MFYLLSKLPIMIFQYSNYYLTLQNTMLRSYSIRLTRPPVLYGQFLLGAQLQEPSAAQRLSGVIWFGIHLMKRATICLVS